MATSHRTVQGPAGRLAVTESGTGGLPVLFVHSLSGKRAQWAAQQAHLKQRTIAFDMRGMGESDTDSSHRYRYTDIADDVAAVADALGLERFVLVGHSFGGCVVGEYARRFPERLAGLGFVDTASLGKAPTELVSQMQEGFKPENYRGFMDKWFNHILLNATPATHDAVMNQLHATPREVVVTAIPSMADYDADRVFERYQGPRFAIAAKDFVSPVAYHVRYPDLPHRVLSGVSHWLMMDAPEAFNAALDALLAPMT